MKLTSTFLRFTLSVICLAFITHQGFAQVTYSSKNTSTATGNVGTVPVTDVSNNGATVVRLSGDETPVNFPMIGISLTAASPILKSNGSYDILYTYLVQNYGAINLNNVQVTSILNAVFPSPLTYTKVSLSSTANITVNPGYNGSSDTNLLTPGSSSLATGSSGTITLTINVIPNATYGTYNNSATATGVTANTDAITVTDVSTNNTSPIHGDATKTPLNFTDPTPITISPSDIEIIKTASSLSPNTGDNITFTIKATNLGAGDAAPVVVNDILNTTGYSLISATPSKGTYDNTTGVWSIGTLNVGASNAATLTILAVVLADKPVASAINTASSNHPGDPVTSNNSSTVNVVPNQAADLRISNTDNQTSYTPGVNNTYTVVATNPGASIANGSRVLYTVPAGISAVWTAVYAGGATGNSGGVNNINELVNMPPGSTVTYTVTTTIPSSQAGVFTTTASIIPPADIVDVTPANNSATDDDVKQGDAELFITNTDSKSAYIPGVGNTYTVIATNSGPSDAPGTSVSYLLPNGITGSWTAVYVGGSTGAASGTNSINEVVNMPTGSAVIYTVNTTIPSSFSGSLTTTATITPSATVIDPTSGNNTATDIDIQNSTAELSITNTDGKAVYVPGLTNTYTVVVSNTGPSDAFGATVTFPLPSDVTGSWSASFSGGATGIPSGSNSINERVNLPAGSSITYIIIADIASSKTDATLPVVATVNPPAELTDPTPTNNTATDTDTRVGGADLSITLTDGKTTYTPGTTNTYIIVATNNGPSDVAAANISFPLPIGAVATWTATHTGGASGTATGSNSINETVNLPAGSTITYIISGAIGSGRIGDLSLTATVSMPAGSPDPIPANNSATDIDTQSNEADLTITNTDNKLSYTPGTTNTYTVVATNTGPSNAPASTITYTLPAGITATWTAVFTGGATGAATGTNNINEIVNMPASGTATYTITATIPSSQTGIFTTTASIAAASGITDLTPANNTQSDADLKNGDADLKIVNTDNKAVYTPGTTNAYTIVASNDGPSDVVGATITYPLPAGVTGTWTAVYNAGATGNNSGSGNINELVNIPIGGTVTYTLIATIPSSQTGVITTVATIAAPIGVNDPLPNNNTSSDTDLRIGDSDLSITNSDSKIAYTPGINNTYTIVASNAGPSNVTGAVVNYTLPAGITGTWTATYAGGATGAANGTNGVNETVNMPIGSTITYTFVAVIPAGFSGALPTTASINSPAGTTDADFSNNESVDIDGQNSISNLAITNTDNKVVYTPGVPNTYTVIATNSGPSNAPGTTISYTSTAVGISGAWTAVYSGGATGNASGTGAINELVNLPAEGSVTYTAVVTIPSGQTIPTLTTNASITPASGITDLSLADNSASDTDVRIGDADLSITNTDNQSNYIPGINNTYTVVATNNGPSDVTGANISYQLPIGATASWTAVYTGGATGDGSGSNRTNQVVNMPSGSTITYTLNVNVPSNQTGDFTTLATISLPSGSGDPVTANNTASDTDAQNSNADLSITNTDSKTVYTPGTTNTYVVVATNNGPSDAPGSIVTYNLPTGISGNWTAIYAGGATGAASGTGNINETVNMPKGSAITYTITANVPSNIAATSIITTATIATASGITDPTPSNNTAIDIDLRSSSADLAITNTDSKANYIPGTTNTYTVVATNSGPSDVVGATVTYPVPAGVTLTWVASYASGATGNVSGTGGINEAVNMPSGSSITYTVTATIPSNLTGSISTTATIAGPGTLSDPTPANNTATDVDTQNSQADLYVTNTDNQVTYTPGTTNTYTIVAGNNGPSDAVGTTVAVNTSAAGLTGAWTAVYTGGATGNANGTGAINELVNIPVGGTVTYTAVVTIPSGQTGPVSTTATVTAATGITDPTPENNTATDIDLPLNSFDLSITNTDGKTNYVPGTTNTYTVVANNSGPSDVTGATITYPAPAGVTQSWTAVYSGGATGNINGTSSMNESVNMPAGSSITFTVVATIPANRTGAITTTATIAAPSSLTDPVPANNTATDSDSQNSQADLEITSTDGKVVYTPGVNNIYTIVATNYGPSDAPGANVTATTSATGITATWTAVYSGGASGNASGTGAINETVNLPSGGTVTYTLVANVPSNQTGPFNTTATVTVPSGIIDPVSENNTAIDNDLPLGSFDLGITNTDSKLTYAPGTTNTYTVVASNSGPSDVTGATVTYPVPAGITLSWAAIYANGATGTANGTGAINEIVNMPAGSSITYTVTATIPSNRTGSVTTIASIAAPVNLTDPVTGNNSSTDIDIQSSEADLYISNTDNQITYTPGTTNTYTIVAGNTGPSDAQGSRVIVNTSAAGLTGSWTAVYTGGATGNASGTGSINELVNLPAGSTVTYTALVSIPSGQTGAISTTATVTGAVGLSDPTPDNNTDTDTDLALNSFDLSITNTDSKLNYIPGTTNTYTLVASNSGPSNVVGATITLPTPTGTSLAWTAVYTGAATGNTSGTGAINETVNMPAGSSITYTVVATISSNRTGVLVTTATIASPVGLTDPVTANNTATDIDAQNSVADLSITNSDGKTNYIPGTTNTYTVLATNNGPSDALGSTVTYTLPTGINATWTAVYSGGATGAESGTNSINEIVNLPFGSTATYTVVATIPSGRTGALSTTAIIATATGITDAILANNTVTDTDNQTNVADLSITNTDGKIDYVPGTTNTYTVVATNNGSSDALGSTVTYSLPAGINGTWIAAYSGAATGNASGTGSINETVNLPAGTAVTYTIVATIPSSQLGSITTTATINPATGITDNNLANNTASDVDTKNSIADLVISNTDNKVTYIPGTTNTYILVATNKGPSDAIGSRVTATTSAVGLTANWTAVYAGGATGTASGTGSINELVNIPVGASVTYTVVVNVPSSQTGVISTTAIIAAAAGITDPTPADNTATDTDLPVGSFDLSITNTDSKLGYVPGATNTYSVVASNSGPSDVSGATITYPAPTGVTLSWTASYGNGATGNASGTGAINETVNMPAGSTITYTVIAAIPASRTGTVVTTATITPPISLTDPVPANNTATDTDIQNSEADLGITSTDGKVVYTPGVNNIYTIVATNYGPSDAPGANVTATTSATGITATWTAVYTGGASGNASGTGAINETVNLPSGGTVTYTLVANVPSNQTGPFNTTSTVTVPAGISDPNVTNNVATDNDLPLGSFDLSITNTDAKVAYVPGTSNTYTLVATNSGPSDVVGATITYPAPVGVSYSWTAVYTAGATGLANGTGAINQSVNMPAGSTVTYTVTATILSSRVGDLTTVASIAPPTSLTDPVPANNTATDTDVQNSQVDLAITNTDNKLIYNPGTTNTYIVVATNSGPSDAVGSRIIVNTSAGGLSGSWTAVYTGGASGAASGTNSINQLVNIPVGGTVTYTVVVNIPSSQTGVITTNASIAPASGITDTNPVNNTASDTDIKLGDFDLSITNTDNKTAYVPGTTNTYTVIAANSGPSDVTGASITYNAPTGIPLSWTAVYAGGATGASGGTGNINVTANMPAGSSITYTVVATIASNRTGAITTTATIAAPISLTDPVLTNNTAIDVDSQASQADLSITNTDNKTAYIPGTSNTYTVVVANNGPSDVTGATTTYTLPTGVTGTWTAVYTGGATGAASGVNNINELVNIPLNGRVTYTVVANIPANQTGAVSTVATITAPTSVSDLVPANNTATDTDGQNSSVDLRIVKTASTLSQYINSQLTFTLTVTNNGPSAATGVAATDLLPSGFTYVSSTPSIGTYNTTTGVWTIGNLANSTSATINMVAIVKATGNYTNIATVTGTETDNDLTNNTSQITITARQLPVAVNDVATTIPNTSVAIPILANDVKGFADLNPASVVIVQQPANGTLAINNTTGVVTYNPAAGYLGTDVFTYTVKDINGQISNVATVNITINDFPIIGLAKSAKSVVKQVNGAYDITYVLTVGNYGVTDLTEVGITDDLSQTFKLEQIKVKSITSLGSLKVNNAYDGIGVREMLQPGNTLAKNQIEQIQVVVNVLVSSGQTTFLNSAYARGTSTTGLNTEDKSTDGLKPDPTTGGDVSPSDPTPVNIGKPNFHIPAGFSPNGDGTHDTFVIEGAGSSKVNFEVYNRWGNLVYRDTDYKNDWSGKCNQGIHIGDDLPEGTYFYIIVIDGTDKYNGPLTLNR